MDRLRYLIIRIELMRLEGLTLTRRDDREEGQTIVEYALILVSLAVLVVIVVARLGAVAKSIFTNVASSI
jgi:Flp pilus assembly pilin Flp